MVNCQARTGHDVEVVEIELVRRPDRVVAAGNEHEVPILHGERLIERAIICIDALQREP